MQIIGSPRAGGAETFYLRLVKALLKQADVVPVVREQSWIANHLEEAGIAAYTLPFMGKWDFKTKSRLKKIIEDEKPDLIQSWMNRASRALPKTTVPTVGRMGGYYKLKNYDNCDWIIGNTQDICDYVKGEGWAKNRTMYVPNFAPAPEDVAPQCRNALGLPKETFAFLMAGRLHDNKAFDVALKALPHMPENVHLLIAGEGAKKEELESILAENGCANRVQFLGWRNDISSLAACVDGWLVPSRHEPLGNVVLDAWMHMKPVIAAASDGPKRLIENGKTGLLFDVDDVDGLAAAVTALVHDKAHAQEMATAGHAYVQKHFSEKVILDQYLEFYATCLAQTEEAA